MRKDMGAIPGSREPSLAARLGPTGFDPERVKPSLPFLRKVERGEVKRVRGYTARKGGYERFLGGEKQWELHYRAGYVTRAPTPMLGQPSLVALTEKGRAAIAMETRRAETGNTDSAAKP